MKRSMLLPVAAFLVLTATVAGLYLAQPSPLAQRVKDLETDLTNAQNEIARLKADRDKLLASRKSDPPPLQTATPTAPAKATPPLAATDPARQIADDAANREAMFKYRESSIQREYGRLIKQLGLNDEEATFFKRLIFDRQAKLTEITIQSGVATTAAQKKALSQKIAATRTECDAAMQRFLDNNDDYQTYQQWEDTALERLQIQQAVTNFDSAGETLSAEQRDQLFDLMVAHRLTVSRQPTALPPGATQATISEDFQKRRTASEENIRQQAAAFLNPAQLAILEKMHQQRRAYSEAARQASAPKPTGPQN